LTFSIYLIQKDTMSGRNARKIFLGIQWDAASWDDVPLWCDFLFGRLGTAPVCWNFPALPQDGRSRTRAAFLKALTRRIGDAGDVVLPMGFAGACHPLLSLDELEKELAWGVKNPWSTGVTDAFGVQPTILVPRMPDLGRPKAVEAYRRHGFAKIGFASDESLRFSRHPAGVDLFPFIRVPVAEVKPSRRLFPPKGDLFVMLDLTGLSSPRQLEALFGQAIDPLLPVASAALLASAGPAKPAPARDGGTRFDCGLFPPAQVRDALEAVAPLARKRRKRAEEYQEILSTLSPGALRDHGGESGSGGEARGPREARLPVAHMLGEVTLAGSDFDVKLAGGRFCGIVRRGEALLPARPARSYIRVAGRTLSFRTKSSFSFESDAGTGLREELVLDSPAAKGASLDIEYTFRDDSPLLTILADVRYPRPEADGMIEEFTPFSIALTESRTGCARVEASAPDGSSASYSIRDRDGWVAVPGAAHAVALRGGGRLVLRFAREEARQWGLPFFRVARSFGTRAVLEVNPFGCPGPIPARRLGDGSRSFTFLLGIEGR
jgi:hypothetical protein